MARISQLGAPARHLAKTFNKFGSKASACFKPVLKNLPHGAVKFGTTRALPNERRRTTGRAHTMWFLIKGSFWFSLVLITLPVLDSGSRETLEGAPQLEVGQSMAAAVEALADIKQICERKPDICETGSETFAALGVRAREGARIAYQFLDSKFADGEPDLVTGSLPVTN
jgi:hypothetical protein